MKLLFCAKFLSQIHYRTNKASNSSYYTTSEHTTQHTETVVIAVQSTDELKSLLLTCLVNVEQWRCPL